MHPHRWSLLLLLAGALACRSGKTVPEEGAVLLHVKLAPGAPTPDELAVWVYDDTGRLWDGVRIPGEGPLPAASGAELGTILVQPGAIAGRLRIHLRGFADGARVLDGTLVVPSLDGDRVFDVVLDSAWPVDADDDGVPDAIDDCPQANPAQGACPAPGQPDGGPDAPPRVPSDGGELAEEVAVPGGDAADEPASGLPDVPIEAAAEVIAVDVAEGQHAEVADVRSADVADGARVDTADGREADTVDAGQRDGGDAPSSEVGDAATERRDGREAVDLESAPPCDGDDCKKPQGAACLAHQECSSGACADGVCCANACLGPCRSCNQPGTDGVCQGYPSGTDPELECPSSSCNGVGDCGPVTSNLANGSLCNAASQCASGFCADGVCCDAACDQVCQTCGSGACLPVKKADDVPECAGATTCNPRGSCVTR